MWPALVDLASSNVEASKNDVQSAARSMGLRVQFVNAANSRDINAAFAALIRERPDALSVGPGPLFVNRRVQLALLAAHHKIPAIYPGRENVAAGGLMGYGANVTDAYR